VIGGMWKVKGELQFKCLKVLFHFYSLAFD